MTLKEKMERRSIQLMNDHIKKSKMKGDYHHQKALQMGAVDDYTPADHGNAPKGESF